MTRKVFVSVFLFAVALAVLAVATPAEAKGPCICPQVYAPVECSNGKTYPNQCVADCRHAQDCVPVGFPVEATESAEGEVAYPWLDSALSSEILSCADERGAKLIAVPLDEIETGKMLGKGKPNPCNSCNTTLGPCDRISCKPCCYTCPDIPYGICVDE